MAFGGSDQPGGSSSEERVQPASSRVQKDFCIKRVYKLMKSVLPKEAQITKKSKQYMVECAAEFISFVTREAKYFCQLDQRNTITAEDLIDAMQKMGLDVIADYSFRYNQHYHNFHASANGQYAAPPPPLPQDVQACVISGQYYAPPPPPLPQDVQARVSGQFYAPPPPPLPQDVQARVSGQYYAPPPPPLPQDVQACVISGQYYAPPPPPLPQDVQARVSGQYYARPPPPMPLLDVEARNFPMAPNFMFSNPIELSTFFGVDDEVLPPPPLPQNVQAVSGRYYAPPLPPLPSQDVQARNFSMAPNFMFSNPIEMDTFFGGDDDEELPPPLLSQDVQGYVSGQSATPPPSLPPQDDQPCYFPMTPNFKFPNPIKIGAFFGDDDGEELPPPPPPPLPQDVQARVSGQYAPPPPPQDVQARDFPMAPNSMFSDPIKMGSLFGDGYGEELGGGSGGDGDGNLEDEGFDLIAFLNSYDK